MPDPVGHKGLRVNAVVIISRPPLSVKGDPDADTRGHALPTANLRPLYSGAAERAARILNRYRRVLDQPYGTHARSGERAGSLSKEMSGVVARIRKEQGFVREIYTGSQAVIPLPDLDIELTLADVYADVELYSRGGLNPLRDNSANN